MKALLVRPGWGDAGFVITDPAAIGNFLGALNWAVPVKEGLPIPKSYGTELLVSDSAEPPVATLRVDLIDWPSKAERERDASGREWGDSERVAEREKWAAQQVKASPAPDPAPAPAAPSKGDDDVPF